MLHQLISSIPLTIVEGEHVGEWIGYVVSALATGSLTWIATIKYTRQQAKSDAMKSVQDVYQELIDDLKRDREDLKEENEKLRELINEQNNQIAQLRRELEDVSKRCTENERKVTAQERKINGMKPLICTVVDCPNRCNKQ